MKLKVIVKVPGHPGSGQLREHLIQRYRIDATDILEMALCHWQAIEENDDEALHAALEYHLAQRHRRVARSMDHGRLNYSDYMELIRLLSTALCQVHEMLHPILHPLVEPRWRQPVDYRLARFIGMDAAAVIEIEPR